MGLIVLVDAAIVQNGFMKQVTEILSLINIVNKSDFQIPTVLIMRTSRPYFLS